MKKVLGYTAYFLAIIIFSAFFIRYIGQRTIVEGNSMLPALADADQLVNLLPYTEDPAFLQCIRIHLAVWLENA